MTWLKDCCGQIGLSLHQKTTSALCQLAYGFSADLNNKYVCIGKTTALQMPKYFTRNIVSIYGPEYLCPPQSQRVEGYT
jgi:hypothetical protein